MNKEAIEKCESLLRIEQEYDETSDNGSNVRDSMTVALTNAGIDEWINSDSSRVKPKRSMPDSRTTDENDIKKRKRGRRGGKRRGFDDEKPPSGGLKSGKQMQPRRRGSSRNDGNKKQGVKKTDLINRVCEGIIIVKQGAHTNYHCEFCNCLLNSLSSVRGHVRGLRHRTNVRMRDLEPRKKRDANTAKSDLENSAADKTSLRNLPDGILLIESGRYFGYHCAFCNCSLSHISKIKDHVAGFRHQLIIEARSRLEEQEKTEANTEKSASEKSPEKSKEKEKNKAVPEKSKEKEKNKEGKSKEEDKKIKAAKVKDEEKADLPLEDTKSSVPLKSSLEDNLATLSEPVVGLSYVIEKQKQGEEPSFECSLCNVVSDADDMKAHILGTRHRLMYMKITDTQKIAELMAKNLPKGERNKEIREYIASAMEKHGRGTIVVEISDTEKSKKIVAKSLPKVQDKKENIASDTDKHGKGAITRETSNISSSKAFQRKDQEKTADKSRKDVAAPGAVQHKRINEEGTTSKRKRNRGSRGRKTRFSNSSAISPYGDSYSQVDQQSYYDYDRQSHANDKGRLPEPLPPSENNEEMATESPKMPGIDVTNEEEAGIVMNVISSLTERFLHYKLKNVAGPTREIVEKSLKGKKLLQALSLITDEDNAKPTDKPSSEGREIARPNYKETVDAASARNMMERTYQDIPIRKPIEQSQHDWVEERSKDIMGHSQYDWIKVMDRKAVDPVQPPSSWEETRDARSSNVRSLSQGNWDSTRDGKNLIDQLPSSWNTTRNISERGTSSLQLKQDWSDILPSSQDSARNVLDRGTSSLQLKQDWNDIRGSAYGKNTMNQSKYDWIQAESATNVRNLNQPNWEATIEKSKIMDPLKYDRNEGRNLPSRDDRLFDRRQYSRSSILEDNRKSDSSSQFLNWTEPRQASLRGNIDSLDKRLYYSEKSENIHPLRSTAASFNQQDQNWAVDRPKMSQAQQAWNKTGEQVARGVSDRSFGYSAMARDDKTSIYGRGTSGSLTSQLLQSTTSSLPQRSVSYATAVNDIFDRYEKQLHAEKSRDLLTRGTSGSRSYTTPSLTTRLRYLGPSTPSSFSRPSTSLQWK